jgi:hypothetical protein
VSFDFTAEDATILASVIPAVAAAWHLGLRKITPKVIKTGDAVVADADQVVADVAPALTDTERAELMQALHQVNALGSRVGLAPVILPSAMPTGQTR